MRLPLLVGTAIFRAAMLHRTPALLTRTHTLPPPLPLALTLTLNRGGGAARMLSGVPDTTIVGTCKQKIADALEPQELEVKGAFDDPNGSHIAIYCVSEKFEGLRSLKRQQLVFKAIWEEMQGPVHAVDEMVLKAPSEM